MKVLSWIIALCGLWEFADIVALFVPGFGNILAPVWNHIIVGLILMIVGIRAVLTRNAGTTKTMHWIGAAASVWLMSGSFILRKPVLDAGFWNDIIVGVIVLTLSTWAALALSR